MTTLLDRLNSGATVEATVVYDTIDYAFSGANSAGSYANSAYLHANAAYAAANTAISNNLPALAFTTANAAFLQANSATQYSLSAGSYANSSYLKSNTASLHSISGYTHANSAYTQANTATTNAATADQRAVTSGSYANSAFAQANTGGQNGISAGSYANSAYTKANNSIQSVDGTSGRILANTSGNTVSLNLSTTSVSSGTYGTTTAYPIVTVDPYGRITNVRTQLLSTNLTTFGVTYDYDKFNGDGSTLEFTLSKNISGANTLHVFVNGVAQEYQTVWDASGTTLTFTSGSAPPSGTNNIVVEYLNQPGAVGLIDSLNDESGATDGRAATPLAVNTVYLAVQTAGNYANAAFEAANNSIDTWVRDAANSAGSYANSAYSSSNTKFSSSGGTISGAVTISSGGLNVTGAITSTGDITAFYSSDERLKSNIIIIDSALDKIQQIDGVYYEWNETALNLYPEKNKKTEIGVLAQQVQKVLPEVVTLRDDGYYAVRYEKIIALLIEGMKELKQEIDVLKGHNGTN